MRQAPIGVALSERLSRLKQTKATLVSEKWAVEAKALNWLSKD
jgi:hypothetical protein